MIFMLLMRKTGGEGTLDFSGGGNHTFAHSEIVPFEFVNEAKATMPDIGRWVREEIGENEEFIIIGV